MISYVYLFQMFLLFFGIASSVSTFWIGKQYNWSDEFQVSIAILIAIGTVLFELLISFNSMKNSIEQLYPALELSIEEQRNINESILLNNKLKTDNSPAALIALDLFKETNTVLKKAIEHNEYIINDIFKANMIALKSMKKGQRFCGISALIKPEFWKYGKQMIEYKEANFTQARNGVIIDRIFIFNNEEEITIMKNILNEQLANGINVYCVLKKDINHITHYPDFSVIEDLNFGLIVHSEDMLERVTVTQNNSTIAELSSQFERLMEVSKKHEQ